MSYVRVLLRGTLPGGEVWSVNPCYNESTNVTGYDQAKGDATATAIAAIAVPAALQSLASTQGKAAQVRIERRSDDHLLVGASEVAWNGIAGNGRSPIQSGQAAVVLSLRTGIPGASNRGRLYWPALGAELDPATLRLGIPKTSAVAAAAVSYLDAIETALKEGFFPSPALIDYHLTVVSKTRNQRTDVKTIQVGDVIDVQRRRRDSLVEAYASANYPG